MNVVKNKKTPFKLKKVFRTTMLLTLAFATFSCSNDDGPAAPKTIEVSTLAGSTVGYSDGTGSEAKFNSPTGVAVDNSGNLYIVETNNHRVRKITPSGVVTTIAGSTSGYTDGVGSEAKFSTPVGIAIDASGNLYVADLGNHKVRKVLPDGTVSTLAGSTIGYVDGTSENAKFNQINGIAVDNAGNVYVTDKGNTKIRKITPEGVVSTLAGSTVGFADGAGSDAKFGLLRGISVDGSGNVYVADDDNHKIRKITPSGVVSTLAGTSAGDADGSGDTVQFDTPTDVAVDASGNVYIADWKNHKIRKILPTGVVSTLAGNGTAGYVDGFGESALFKNPYGVAVDASNTVYVADPGNAKIRKITQK